MSKTLESLSQRLPETVTSLLRTHPVAASLYTATAIGGFWWAAADYARWKSLGPGGAPYNVFGWLLATMLIPFSTSTRLIRDTTELKKLINESGAPVAKILDLPSRTGEQPQVAGLVPQRQLTQRGSKTFSDVLNKFLSELAETHPSILFIARSINEGGHAQGLFLRPSPGSTTTDRVNEIAHVHYIDGALHVPLSPADATEAIDKGWGVRHRLSGRLGLITHGLVLIYSPRDLDEVEVVKGIIRASLEFKTGLKM